MAGSSKKAIYAALVGNSLIAVTKFFAAAYTGSAAMLSEGIHSMVDTGNQVLLLFGLRQANKPASPEYPFGHGKEIYFWCFIVAMLIFALGGAVSIYHGISRFSNPEPIANITINYFVLGLAMVFEFGALYVAFKEFNKSRGDRSIFEAVVKGKDPTLFVVVFEDSAAMLGLMLAFIGLLLVQFTGNQMWDAIASISIGVTLILTAFWLALESKGLLIGEAAGVDVREGIAAVLNADGRIANINEVSTLHMGPQFIVVAISLDYGDSAAAQSVQAATTDLNAQIKQVDPRIRRVFIEAEAAEHHSTRVPIPPVDG